MTEFNMDELVQTFLALRSERECILREYEDADRVLKDDMDKIKTAMLGVCNEVNADSLRTSHGTVMRRVTERFYCTDWENFRRFELENPELDLRERRIHQTNFRQYTEEAKDDGLPPGINVLREYDISVRRAPNNGAQ